MDSQAFQEDHVKKYRIAQDKSESSSCQMVDKGIKLSELLLKIAISPLPSEHIQNKLVELCFVSFSLSFDLKGDKVH